MNYRPQATHPPNPSQDYLEGACGGEMVNEGNAGTIPN
jgi:hypothetical protein